MKRIKAWLKDQGRKYGVRKGAASVGLPPEHWGLTYHHQALSYHTVALADVLKRWGSPLHVVFPEKLLSNLKGFQSAGLEVFYSYKTNPLPWVFQQLHHNGAGAEVISAYELWLALKLGVPPHLIIYNGPAKSADSLRVAIERGIASINVNNLEELEVISALATSMQTVANVGIRVTSAQGWTGQFGFPVEDGSALQAYQRALALPSLNVVALHCHRGALIRDRATLQSHMRFMLDFAQELKTKLHWWPSLLDVGGSLAIPSAKYLSKQEAQLSSRFLVPPHAPNPADCLTPEDYAREVVRMVTQRCGELGLRVPRLVSEVGRALTGNSQMLLTTVQNTRKDQAFDFAVLDAGVSVASIVTSEYHECLPLAKKPGPKHCHRLVGPICHMGDTLYTANYQPAIEVGDALAIMDSGAYFIADASSFSFGQPGVVALYANGEQVLVRQHETFEHLISLDTIAPTKQ
ncbi:diaminopimelate decarboxylase family protein [Rhodoferax aquaticus]|uniref:Pyridoxal-dependent decarboxylase n=1 Tax=Rhodoferax aquaticus TaxID=2527691 RepID=A0A515EP61_9BURK|nr:pyridoxal-dependent decarboxylase [Rhodoferax aquaticus]QDL54457.1 pyridoxal-dependent decarboxylase [Rhodoferax aquaticus]